MASRVKYEVEIEPPDDAGPEIEAETRVLTFKRWSTRKSLQRMRDIIEIAQQVGLELGDLADGDSTGVADKIMEAGENALGSIADILRTSLADQSLMTVEDFMELALEDFLGCLVQILDLNMTDKLRKNCESLKASPLGKMFGRNREGVATSSSGKRPKMESRKPSGTTSTQSSGPGFQKARRFLPANGSTKTAETR